jgi:DNA-binding transcriptional MerR regulator
MALAKSAEAFRTISEAAGELDVPQHVLRHWEEVFGQIRPMRRAGGRRYYRPLDIDVLRGVRFLLREHRYTTEGVQKIFKQYGVKYVAEIGRMSAAGQTIDLRSLIDEDAGDRQSDLAVEPLTPGDQIILSELPEPVRRRLQALLAKLERIQDALDEATLAIEAIDAEVEGDR